MNTGGKKGTAMIRRINLTIVSIALVLAYLQLISCSLIGYEIGSITDDSASRKEIYSRASTDTTQSLIPPLDIQRGEVVTIATSHTDLLSGEFLGLGVVSEKDYARQYSAYLRWQEENVDDSFLPLLGQEIIAYMNLSDPPSVAGRLEGFDHRFIHIKRQDRSRSTKLGLNSITFVEVIGGDSLSGVKLRQLVLDEGFPLKTVLLLRRERLQDTVSIALGEVKAIHAKSQQNGALIGGLVGLGLDIAVVAILIHGLVKGIRVF